MYRTWIKPFFDKLIALILIVILLPFWFTVLVLLTIGNRGKPFFYQVRPGKNERLFRLVKFRTMNNLKDRNGDLLPDEKRLTKVGRWVRKLSLDEIPQLLNVINGDMSLIGPRPLLVDYLPLYNEFQKRRHEVTPGISGWAQVNGRNNLPWNKRFEYDIWYVDHQSFALDLKIICMTIWRIIERKDINQDGEATVVYFKGNQNESTGTGA
jgi:lipopolysaccharide/colanic/teichoic acid biosynthesis glycosyltransferase